MFWFLAHSRLFSAFIAVAMVLGFSLAALGFGQATATGCAPKQVVEPQCCCAGGGEHVPASEHSVPVQKRCCGAACCGYAVPLTAVAPLQVAAAFDEQPSLAAVSRFDHPYLATSPLAIFHPPRA
jgi:hypothetical protein